MTMNPVGRSPFVTSQVIIVYIRAHAEGSTDAAPQKWLGVGGTLKWILWLAAASLVGGASWLMLWSNH